MLAILLAAGVRGDGTPRAAPGGSCQACAASSSADRFRCTSWPTTARTAASGM